MTLVTAAFERLGWGVVDNSRHDVGTDLLCMARDQRLVELGLVVGVQVKAGRSFFRRPKRDRDKRIVGWWFEDTRRTHLNLWASYSIPHLLVLHDADAGISYWVHVTRQAVIAAGRGARILVPVDQVLDDANRDALLAVAGSTRPAVPLEGTAWVGALNISDSDVLRYALIVPRLVAPHPNDGVARAISAGEALALVVQARGDDLARFAGEHPEVPTMEQAAGSADWDWRFVAAVAQRVESGEVDLLRARVADAPDARRRAAATAALVVVLSEQAAIDEARGLLEVFDDEPATTLAGAEMLSPIDKAWMSLHRAHVDAEVGQLDGLQNALAETVLISPTYPHDVTAAAIAGAASTLLFRIAGSWSREDLMSQVTRADTAASWWNTSTVASGLAAANDRHFRAWSRERSIVIAAVDTTNDRLITASLAAGHLGDGSSWRRCILLLAQDAIARLDRFTEPDRAASLLLQLRVAGDRRSVQLATQRLVVDGPAAAAAHAAASFDLRASTWTTGSADVELLHRAGDVLDEDVADRSCRWLIDTIADPQQLIRRATPSYRIPDTLINTLAGVVPASTPPRQQEIAALLAGLPDQVDQSTAIAWARLVHALAHPAWDEIDLSEALSRNHHDSLRLPLLAIAAGRHTHDRDTLLELVRQGRLDALAALGDVRRLPDTVVEMLRTRCVTLVRAIVRDAHEGSFEFGDRDAAADLALLNLWHPQGADWDPVTDLLGDPLVSAEHKNRSLQFLAGTTARLDEPIRHRLAEIITDRIGTSPHDAGFADGRDSTGPATELAAALGVLPPGEMAARLYELLEGRNRRWAARVAARLPGTEHVGILVALTADADPHVRATAAAGLTRAVLSDAREDLLAATTLAGCVNDPGTAVPLGVATVLGELDRNRRGLPAVHEQLSTHRSARVRALAKCATDRGTDG